MDSPYGGSSADFRAYSIERTISYQLPVDPAVLDSEGQPVDGHANYLAGSRNSSAALYSDNFGGVQAPQAQIDLYPQQFGTTPLGSLGMEWHDVEITKIGNIVTWSIDGVDLIIIDMTHFTTQPDGTNIAFGHADINAGSSAEPSRFDLQFSLYDNITVEAIAAGLVGDYNNDGTVDAADYVKWRKEDINGAQGYTDWRTNFGAGTGGGGAAALSAVPEPSTMLLVFAAVAWAWGCCRRRA